MGFWNQLETRGKWAVGILAILLLAGGAYWFHGYNKEHGVLNKATKEIASDNLGINEEADGVIAYNTFVGMEGLLLYNGGMEPNEESRLYKEFGIKLQIKKMDVVQDTRDGLKAGVLDAVYCTIDALPIEASSGSQLLEIGTKVIFKVNESRGADALVVVPGINKVEDLKGKRIAYAVGTASNTLLINILEASGLKSSDIEAFKVADGIEAANAFKAGQCDAALVWAPDDADCVAAIKGSKVLASTETATQIIADGLLVTEDNLKEKRELLTKIIAAWCKGNALINSSTTARKEANELFAKHFDFPADVAAISSTKVRFCTLQDNKNFFGLDPTYTGVTGEKMYGRMAVKYTEAGLAKAPASWRVVSDESVIQDLLNTPLAADANQGNAPVATFTPPTKADETKEAVGSKHLTLNFDFNSAVLTEANQNIIDREVTALAQGFEKARIRVEGNTDNVGSATVNKALSYKRAQSVVNYLVSEHKFDRNKFVVVGNGPTKPVCSDDSESCRAANRRTDVNFLW